jgi:hypothetical protein
MLCGPGCERPPRGGPGQHPSTLYCTALVLSHVTVAAAAGWGCEPQLTRFLNNRKHIAATDNSMPYVCLQQFWHVFMQYLATVPRYPAGLLGTQAEHYQSFHKGCYLLIHPL